MAQDFDNWSVGLTYGFNHHQNNFFTTGTVFSKAVDHINSALHQLFTNIAISWMSCKHPASLQQFLLAAPTCDMLWNTLDQIKRGQIEPNLCFVNPQKAKIKS